MGFFKVWKSDLCWIMLNSPHTGLSWIVLKSLESRLLFDFAQPSTCRSMLDCAK